MDTTGAEEHLERCRNHVRRGNYPAALKSLEAGLKQHLGPNGSPAGMPRTVLDRLPSELLSYYGLCIACAENRVQEGLRFCEMALARGVLRPEFHLNLGRIYLKIRQREKALKVFRTGLELTEKNHELLQEVQRLGFRRKPLFSILPRRHFLNRYLGLLVHHWTGKKA
jgi:tetratricopeptide (TPR) repeat protein